MRGLVYALTALAIYASLWLFSDGHKVLAQEKSRVDNAIVFVIDVSSSVDDSEYAVQMQGLADALTDPQILRTVRNKVLTVRLFFYAGSVVDPIPQWFYLQEPDDFRALAVLIRATSRPTSGSTMLTPALQYAANLYQTAPFVPDRAVVDISTDGMDDAADPNGRADARAVLDSMNVAINCIILPDTMEKLEDVIAFHREEVKQGVGSFVMVVESIEFYPLIFRKKLILEVSSAN